MKREWLSKWLGVFIFGVALITVYKTFDNITHIFAVLGRMLGLFTPFILGFLLAFFLYPGCVKLEKLYGKAHNGWLRTHKRTLGILTVYFAFLLLLLLAIAYLLPKLSASLADLINNLPMYLSSMRSMLEDLKQNVSLFSNLDVDQIMDTFKIESLLQNFLSSGLDSYIAGFKGVTTTLMSWFMGIVICAYTLLEKNALFGITRRIFGKLFSPRLMDGISAYLHKISCIFYDFFFGKMVESLIVGLIGTIGFYLLGVPFALLMGIVLTLFNMIPYFGPIIGAVPIVLVSLFMGDVMKALWVGIFILCLQQLDGIYIGPRILGNSVGVSPFWVIFAILIGGGLFGLWGMLFGVPLIAVVRMLILDYLDDGKLDLSVGKKANGSPSSSPSGGSKGGTDT